MARRTKRPDRLIQQFQRSPSRRFNGLDAKTKDAYYNSGIRFAYKRLLFAWMLGTNADMTIDDLAKLDEKTMREQYLPQLRDAIKANSMTMHSYTQDPSSTIRPGTQEFENQKVAGNCQGQLLPSVPDL